MLLRSCGRRRLSLFSLHERAALPNFRPEIAHWTGGKMRRTDAAPTSAGNGYVAAVRGSVLDLVFAPGDLPGIGEAVRIAWDAPGLLIAEVQSHRDEGTIRAVAMRDTAGLRRGTSALRTGAAITVPVGEVVLGRMLDVIGLPQDDGPALPPETPRWPIHRTPPPLAGQLARRELFEYRQKARAACKRGAPRPSGGYYERAA
jgi:flagellar biosynthesis/type III secretory pathway ATPase